MSHSPLRTLAALSPLVLAIDAPAQTAFDAVAAPAREAHVAAHLSVLTDSQLKAFYLRCSGAALRGELGAAEIAACSIGYERLLAKTFGGDFPALLTWSREQAHK